MANPIFDVHCHFPRNWQDPDSQDNAKAIDERADALRAAGVVKASLLAGGRFGLSYEESLEYARRHEDFFLPSAVVDPEDIDGRAVQQLFEMGYVGLKMIGVKRAYDDLKYFSVYEMAERLGMPILLHMGVIGGPIDYAITHPRRDKDAAKTYLASQERRIKEQILSFGRNASATRMRPFHMDTIANNFPDLRLIGAHLGGTGNYDESASVARWRPNVLFDMSGGDTIERHAVDRRLIGYENGVEKLVWGSDCGNDEISSHVDNLEEIFTKVGLTDDEAHRIRWSNAAEIFGLEEPVLAQE